MTRSDVPIQHKPQVVAAVAVALLTILSSAGAWLGDITIINNRSNPSASVFGFGVVMIGIAVIFIMASPSYGRLSAFLYRPLGVVVLVAGFGFASGGLAAAILPQFNYLGVWGTEVGVAVLIGLLVRGVVSFFGYINRNKKYIKSAEPKIDSSTIFLSRSGNNWFSLFAGGAAVVLLMISFWV